MKMLKSSKQSLKTVQYLGTDEELVLKVHRPEEHGTPASARHPPHLRYRSAHHHGTHRRLMFFSSRIDSDVI